MNADDISTDACSFLTLGAVMYDVIHLLYKSVKMQFTRPPRCTPPDATRTSQENDRSHQRPKKKYQRNKRLHIKVEGAGMNLN